MAIQHQVIRNYPRKILYKFDLDVPWIPNESNKIVFPEDWKDGEWFTVTSVQHYPVERLIVINVNPD
jgi:hypothetical protein